MFFLRIFLNLNLYYIREKYIPSSIFFIIKSSAPTVRALFALIKFALTVRYNLY